MKKDIRVFLPRFGEPVAARTVTLPTTMAANMKARNPICSCWKGFNKDAVMREGGGTLSTLTLKSPTSRRKFNAALWPYFTIVFGYLIDVQGKSGYIATVSQ